MIIKMKMEELEMKRLFSVIMVLTLLFSLAIPVHAETSEVSVWAASSVDFLKERNAVQPELLGDYQKAITRQEFATLIVKVIESKLGSPLKYNATVFTDVDNININKAYTNKIVNGMGNGIFQPNGLITREQIAVMFVNALTSLDTLEPGKEHIVLATTDPNFVDGSKISSWARSSAYLAYNNEIISGVGGGRLDPSSSATREQAMVIAARVWQNLDNPEFLPRLKTAHMARIAKNRTEFDNVISGAASLALELGNLYGKPKADAEGYVGGQSVSEKLVSYLGHEYYTYANNNIKIHYSDDKVVGITIRPRNDDTVSKLSILPTGFDANSGKLSGELKSLTITSGDYTFIVKKTQSYTFEFVYAEDSIFMGVTVYKGDYFDALVASYN